MASVFGHIAASTAIGMAVFPKSTRPLTLAVAGFCAFAPDLDVLAFRFGISYSSEWGHRGWTHSLVMAVVIGLLAGLFFIKSRDWKQCTLWFIASAASHPLLDMLTNGGRGVALWWPFSNERIFFPFRPVQVSPLSLHDFFSPWGLSVLASEVIWIGFPCFFLVMIVRAIKSRQQA